MLKREFDAQLQLLREEVHFKRIEIIISSGVALTWQCDIATLTHDGSCLRVQHNIAVSDM